MRNAKIVIAGGSGFIGESLIKYFGNENKLIILSRNADNSQNNRNRFSLLSEPELKNVIYCHWDGKTLGDWYKQLEDTDILINLSGKSVNCRYTEKNKTDILNSRVDSTKILGEAIAKTKNPPKLWINASSATIYRHSTDKPQDEFTGEIENDFSVQVCKAWENTFYNQATPFTRKIALRMAITLGAGGIMIPYFNLLKFGLGGKQGNGKQMYSWVHIEDSCRMIEWFYEHHELEGTFNCASPYPVHNKEFMKTLRTISHTTFGLPAMKWMLQIGALLIGTETELVLKSRWVVPTRILETGFQFKYPLLSDALAEVFNNTPKNLYRIF